MPEDNFLYDNCVLKNFIVIEGLDGSGTTTQKKLLEQKFNKNNISCHATAEPTDSAVGALIRDALTWKTTFSPYTLALLFAADRNEHLFNSTGKSLISYLSKGYYVVSDRYFFSSIAYQSLACPMEKIISLNSFPLPEFLFFIDVPPEICQKRLQSRPDQELFDQLELQRQVLENYKKGIDKTAKGRTNCCFLDGTETPEAVCEKIWKIVVSPADN